MRKSERIRLLEIEVSRMQVQLETLVGTMNSLLEIIKAGQTPAPSMDAGKWYQKKPE